MSFLSPSAAPTAPVPPPPPPAPPTLASGSVKDAGAAQRAAAAAANGGGFGDTLKSGSPEGAAKPNTGKMKLGGES